MSILQRDEKKAVNSAPFGRDTIRRIREAVASGRLGKTFRAFDVNAALNIEFASTFSRSTVMEMNWEGHSLCWRENKRGRRLQLGEFEQELEIGRRD